MDKREMSHKYILVGRSGAGKSTMAAKMKELGLKRCTTCTTRPPRPGELEKQEYYFLDRPETFRSLKMFEQSEYGGYAYGITVDELHKGDFVILEPKGVDYYRKHYPGELTVISLERDGIHVDPDRMARDKAAGFDSVNPDITVRGETIEEMEENLVAALRSYELRRFREQGISYLPGVPGVDQIRGQALLWFQDATYGLNVSTSEQHRSYRTVPYGYDGIDCFEAADYEKLCIAFCGMVEKGQDCTLAFYVFDHAENMLYSCRLNHEDGKLTGELRVPYLGMDPFLFEPKNHLEGLDLATGGFLATETDCIGWDHLRSEQTKKVQAYRLALAEGRFALCPSEKSFRLPSLDSRIQQASAVNQIHLKKMFPAKSQLWDFAER